MKTQKYVAFLISILTVVLMISAMTTTAFANDALQDPELDSTYGMHVTYVSVPEENPSESPSPSPTTVPTSTPYPNNNQQQYYYDSANGKWNPKTGEFFSPVFFIVIAVVFVCAAVITYIALKKKQAQKK